MQIPVYVINLKRSFDRRDRITEHLNGLGIHFEIVEAIEGSEIPEEVLRDRAKTGFWKDGSRSRYMFKGDIGCVLSHLKIYNKMIDEDIEIACILEDDVICRKEFIGFLDPDNLMSPEWDLLYLGHHTQYSEKEAWSIKKKKMRTGDFLTGEPVELPRGSYGYLIKKEAAGKILKNVYPVRMSQDCYIGNSPAIGIRVRLLSPPCISHIYSFTSTISENETVIYTNTFIESVRKQIRKSYRLFPFLQTIRIRINIYLNLFIKTLRKIGLLRISYAKYY
jgi:glycosyl transferase, family 25